jgi:endonuclease/exonuclease/phosphatase family metal-dependent hydrolase
MKQNITVMTWNVHGEIGASTEKIQRQTDFFDEHHSDTDLFLLQAVNYKKEEDGWNGQLGRFLQYFGGERDYYSTHTGDWAHELYQSDVQPFHNISAPFNRCNLTVSKWPIDRKPLDLRNRGNRKPIGLNYFYTNFLTGPSVSDVHLPDEDTTDTEGLEVWNTSIINGSNWKEEKINALETVYARIYLQNKKTNKNVILGGDFNAPLKELSEQDSDENEIEIIPHSGNNFKATNRPFYGNPYRYRDSENGSVEFAFSQRWKNAERCVFDPEFSDWDMRDTYWTADNSAKKSSTADHTHVVNNGNPANKRLDHILTDSHFDVKACEIQNGKDDSPNGFDASDHAPVVAELELG